MSALRRRLAPFLVVMALAAACGATVAPSRVPAPSVRPTIAAPEPTVVPGAPSRTPAATLPTTTSTEFGTIWDALPTSFPKLPGQTPTELATPASGAFAVNGDAKALAATLRTLLAHAGWTVDVGSPLEDGSVVLEAEGSPKGCRTEVRFTPLSGTVVVTVLYGALCPFS